MQIKRSDGFLPTRRPMGKPNPPNTSATNGNISVRKTDAGTSY